MDKRPWTTLRLWRESRDWTQQELADKAGYESKGHISMLETGEREYSRDSLEKIASAFNAEPWELLFSPEAASALKGFDQQRREAIKALGGGGQPAKKKRRG